MSAQPKPLPVVTVDTREQALLQFRNLPGIHAGFVATHGSMISPCQTGYVRVFTTASLFRPKPPIAQRYSLPGPVPHPPGHLLTGAIHPQP
jgi:hypothetical protein